MSHEWENDLFECDSDDSLVALCLPCIPFGRAGERMHYYPDRNPDNIRMVNTPCIIMAAAMCLSVGWLPVALQRSDMRDKFGIKGNGFQDCMVAWCCTCFAISQMNIEMTKRLGKVNNSDMKQGYVAAPSMSYPQQQVILQHPVHQECVEKHDQVPAPKA